MEGFSEQGSEIDSYSAIYESKDTNQLEGILQSSNNQAERAAIEQILAERRYASSRPSEEAIREQAGQDQALEAQQQEKDQQKINDLRASLGL